MELTPEMKAAAKRGTVRCYNDDGCVVYGRWGRL